MGNAGREPFNLARAAEVWRRIQQGEGPAALAREYKCSTTQIHRYRIAGYAQEKLELDAWNRVEPRMAWEAGRAVALARIESIISVGAEIIKAEREQSERDRGATENTALLSPETYALVAPIVLRAIQEHNRLEGYYPNGTEPVDAEPAIPPRPSWADPDEGLMKEMDR